MRLFRTLVAASLAGLIATPALADRPRDQDQAFRATVDKIARSGGTPLGLVENDRILGVIHL